MPESEIPNQTAGQLITNLDAGNLVAQLDELDGSKNVKAKSNTAIYEETQKLYESAKKSMEKWEKRYCKALKLAKMQPTMGDTDIESKDFPFEGASVSMMPSIFESMLDFHSRVTPELVWASELVSVKINGATLPEESSDEEKAKQEQMDKEKEERSKRVEEYSNYQLANDIPQWRDAMDKALMALPCVGTYYKKTYYDSDLNCVCSDFKTADKIIFDHKCDFFEDSKDKFEELNYSRNEVISFIRGDQDWDIDEDKLEDDKDDFDFVEAHTWIDLDEDGIKEPYTAILYTADNKIVALYPDYDEESITTNDSDQIIKIEDKSIYTQTIFLPDPEGGPMGIGWGILLGPMFTAINTLLRDNLDAGQLNLTTANSALIATGIGKGRGNRQQSGEIDIKQGQLTPVPMGGLTGPLAQNVVQLPFKGPSSVLLEMMIFLIESSQKMTTAAFNLDANPGEAASLYLARLQQGLKIPNAIVMRVYSATRKEFKKIGLLNFKHHDSDYYNKVLDLPRPALMAADFNPEDCDIDLVADPEQGSDIERVGKAQTTVDIASQELATSGRTSINTREANLRLLRALGVPDVDELVPEPPPPGSTPAEKQAAAREAAQLEFMDREMQIKERKADTDELKVELERLKMARDSALELSKLGLKADEDEASITKTYAEALSLLVDKAGLSYMQAKAEIVNIESEMIDAERPNARPNQGNAQLQP